MDNTRTKTLEIGQIAVSLIAGIALFAFAGLANAQTATEGTFRACLYIAQGTTLADETNLDTILPSDDYIEFGLTIRGDADAILRQYAGRPHNGFNTDISLGNLATTGNNVLCSQVASVPFGTYGYDEATYAFWSELTRGSATASQDISFEYYERFDAGIPLIPGQLEAYGTNGASDGSLVFDATNPDQTLFVLATFVEEPEA